MWSAGFLPLPPAPCFPSIMDAPFRTINQKKLFCMSHLVTVFHGSNRNVANMHILSHNFSLALKNLRWEIRILNRIYRLRFNSMLVSTQYIYRFFSQHIIFLNSSYLNIRSWLPCILIRTWDPYCLSFCLSFALYFSHLNFLLSASRHPWLPFHSYFVPSSHCPCSFAPRPLSWLTVFLANFYWPLKMELTYPFSTKSLPDPVLFILYRIFSDRTVWASLSALVKTWWLCLPHQIPHSVQTRILCFHTFYSIKIISFNYI